MASTSTLTVKKVAKLLRQGKKKRHLDGDPGGVRGLYLEIESKTNAHWVLRYQLTAVRTGWASAVPASSRSQRHVARAKTSAKSWPTDRSVGRASRRASEGRRRPRGADLRRGCAALLRGATRRRGQTRKHRDAFLSTLKQYVIPHIGAVDVARARRAARAGGAGAEGPRLQGPSSAACSGWRGRPRQAGCVTASSRCSIGPACADTTGARIRRTGTSCRRAARARDRSPRSCTTGRHPSPRCQRSCRRPASEGVAAKALLFTALVRPRRRNVGGGVG